MTEQMEKIFCADRLEESIFFKMTILLKQSTYLVQSPVKTPMTFITGLEQTTPKFVWKQKDPKEPKQSWERRKKKN